MDGWQRLFLSHEAAGIDPGRTELQLIFWKARISNMPSSAMTVVETRLVCSEVGPFAWQRPVDTLRYLAT